MGHRYAAGVCSVPDCGRAVDALGLCTGHYWRDRVHGEVFPQHPLGVNFRLRRGARATNGPFVCLCPVSRVNAAGVCRCGYKTIHRMSPRLRDKMLAKAPVLADQRVEAA